MIEKDSANPGQARIRKGLSAPRSATCFRTKQDITIPAGTILRSIGDDQYAAAIGFGAILGGQVSRAAGEFVITMKPGDPVPENVLDRVIA